MTNEPRTRRQLREALQQATVRNANLKDAQTEYIRDLQADSFSLGRATSELKKLGYRVVDEHKEYLQREVQRFEAPEELPAAAEARRETLQAVIDALQLTGYAQFALANEKALGGGAVKTRHDTERFWADIQVALEVRAERKRAEERKATEAKIAGLANRPAFATADPRIQASQDLADAATSLGIDGSAVAAFAETVSKLGEPTTATKPAKKGGKK